MGNKVKQARVAHASTKRHRIHTVPSWLLGERSGERAAARASVAGSDAEADVDTGVILDISCALTLVISQLNVS